MTKTKRSQSTSERAKQAIRKQGGIIRTAEAIQAGIYPRTLYQLRGDGTLERLSRGIYRLAGDDPISNIDLVTVALRIPQSVNCLVSALFFHQITTQIPYSVSIALIKGGESPRLDHPPLSIHRFSDLAFREGIDVSGVTPTWCQLECHRQGHATSNRKGLKAQESPNVKENRGR